MPLWLSEAVYKTEWLDDSYFHFYEIVAASEIQSTLAKLYVELHSSVWCSILFYPRQSWEMLLVPDPAERLDGGVCYPAESRESLKIVLLVSTSCVTVECCVIKCNWFVIFVFHGTIAGSLLFPPKQGSVTNQHHARAFSVSWLYTAGYSANYHLLWYLYLRLRAITFHN